MIASVAENGKKHELSQATLTRISNVIQNLQRECVTIGLSVKRCTPFTTITTRIFYIDDDDDDDNDDNDNNDDDDDDDDNDDDNGDDDNDDDDDDDAAALCFCCMLAYKIVV
uniref:Uncharacterized protein n=1 Tax=Glossina morsitans morsitans TaxID=37546 RepID=A0A1B0G924_GLOMM